MDKDKLFAYHRLASLKCLEHVQYSGENLYEREGANSFTSIRKTVEHIITVEKLWLRRMMGMEKPPVEQFDAETAEEAKQEFMLLHAEMELYFSSLTKEQWEEAIDFANLRGDHFQNTREEMLFTFINHASYHRGQITSFLRQFGKEGIPLDYIYFNEKNR